MAHKHAELMKQYAEDASKMSNPWILWEVRKISAENLCTENWCSLLGHPIWNSKDYEYRRIEVQPHPHTHVMKQYALDAAIVDNPQELYEYRSFVYGSFVSLGWQPALPEPYWEVGTEYRRKLNVASNTPLPYNKRYYMPDIYCNELFKIMVWADSAQDYLYLDRGLVFLLKEAAIDKAKALLEIL